MHTLFHLQAEEIIKLHEARCNNVDCYGRIQISCDGVAECRSNSNSMDVYSVRFFNCNLVYPHTIVRPVQKKYKVDPKPYFRDFINDLKNNDLIIKMFIGDNPKRALAREALCHSSLYACEYCSQRAASFVIFEKQVRAKKKHLEEQIKVIEQKIEGLKSDDEHDRSEVKDLIAIKDTLNISLKDITKKKKSQVVWPSSTRNGEPRTQENVLEIVNQIEQNPNLTPDEKKGFVGRSPLLSLETYDFVRDTPCEYMHGVCLGTVKRLVELTFNVGINRTRITKRKLTPISSFNTRIGTVKVVFECSRRARSLDFAVWKGQEFRNLVLFFFPVVIDCLEENAQERKLWLFVAYVVRACTLPQKEFKDIDLNTIESCCEKYYKLYERLFGQQNCSYNTHIVFSHIIEMRAHGPLTDTSAFGFENFYGEMRNSFTPGTVSPLKQIMSKVLLKRALDHHVCKPKLLFTNYETSLECNNLIYTYTNKMYNFYRIEEITGNKLNCVKIVTSDMSYPSVPNLNWRSVGHVKLEQITSEKKMIDSKFAGKVIKVNDTLVTCPRNVLQEK